MKVSKSIALSAAVAGLVAGAATLATAPNAQAAGGKVTCYNGCNGKSGCAAGAPKSTSCSGHMAFKKPMTAAQCTKKGGTTTKASEAPAKSDAAPGGAMAPSEGAKTPATGQ